jgi:tripartite-type tricarboxylate transporter receptor subunit TctC
MRRLTRTSRQDRRAYAPGGPNDIVARLLAEKLTQANGQAFVVENRPGGGSNIGADAVAKSAAGRLHPAGGRDLALDQHDAVPEREPQVRPHDRLRAGVTPDDRPLVLVTAPKVPAKNLKEFVALAKTQPGKMSFGSSGNGASTHLAGEMLNARAGIKTIHVPTRAAAPRSPT